MKHPLAVVLMIAAVVLLAACNDPEDEQVWEDGSTLWLSGTYADTALSWSPYGDVLLFSSWTDASTSLFGADGINTPSERASTSMDEYVGPLGAWNGNNCRIVFTAVNPDSGWGQIRSIAGNDVSATVHVKDEEPNGFPTYNVAGDSILYCSQSSGSWRPYRIPYNYSPDSEGSPLLLTGFPEGDIMRPSYSPETGNWILFQHRASSSDDWDIMVCHPDGSDQRTIAGSSSHDMHPTWGPDDRWIAFTSNRTGNYEIFIAPVENDTLIQVTDDPALDQYPAWNPDNNWIAYSSDRVSGNWNLDIMAIPEPELP